MRFDLCHRDLLTAKARGLGVETCVHWRTGREAITFTKIQDMRSDAPIADDQSPSSQTTRNRALRMQKVPQHAVRRPHQWRAHEFVPGAMDC